MIPTDPNARLSRDELAVALTASGHPITSARLAVLASQGGGPAYDLIANRARYFWAPSLAWANARVIRKAA